MTKNNKETHGKLFFGYGVLTVFFGFYRSAYKSIFQLSVADAGHSCRDFCQTLLAVA